MERRAMLILGMVLSVWMLAVAPHTIAQQEHTVGFVEGRGNDAAVQLDALDFAGVEYTILQAEDYKIDRLMEFSVIGVGVVAYDQNADLKANFNVLKQYVEQGGYLVTLDFQQDSTWDPKYLPHPLTLFDDDLEEGAVLELADHDIWKIPNEITEDNFLGWGGGDFMADGPHEADPPWEPLLIANDWPVIVGAPAGRGYVVFNSLQALQALGRTKSENVLQVLQNLLFWRPANLAVEPEAKLAVSWAEIKR